MGIKERPILFSGAMVRAILSGRKTQTRRVLKPQPTAFWNDGRQPVNLPYDRDKDKIIRCPHGSIGDRLWVREDHYQFGHWEKVPDVKTKKGRTKWKFVADSDVIRYEAPVGFRKGRHSKDPGAKAWHKRLARFMPRWASRIKLEITGVRVERLNDISEGDCFHEGLERETGAMGLQHFKLYGDLERLNQWTRDAKWSFQSLWESINGEGSWSLNPYVWVVEFKRVEA